MKKIKFIEKINSLYLEFIIKGLGSGNAVKTENGIKVSLKKMPFEYNLYFNDKNCYTTFNFINDTNSESEYMSLSHKDNGKNIELKKTNIQKIINMINKLNLNKLNKLNLDKLNTLIETDITEILKKLYKASLAVLNNNDQKESKTTENIKKIIDSFKNTQEETKNTIVKEVKEALLNYLQDKIKYLQNKIK